MTSRMCCDCGKKEVTGYLGKSVIFKKAYRGKEYDRECSRTFATGGCPHRKGANMKHLLLLTCLALASCSDINHPGDEDTAAKACEPYAGLSWWTTSSDRIQQPRW